MLGQASLVAQLVKNLPAMQETWVQSLGQENVLEEGMQPTPVFLPKNPHGQRSLVGYSPRGRKELDTNKATKHTCTRSAPDFCFSFTLHKSLYLNLNKIETYFKFSIRMCCIQLSH